MSDTPTPNAPVNNAPVEPGVTPSVSNESGDLTKQAVEAMKKYKVKVDGQELEVDEKELLRGYSHQRAANKALQEGKQLRKQAEDFIAMMKAEDKLFDVIKKLGHDPRTLAEKYLASQLEDELMDPRDKELRDTKAKLKQIEDMERMQREEVERRRNEALKAKYAEDFSKQFESALKESKLPPTKQMVSEMAKYVSRAAQIGFKMTPQEAAQLVKEDIQRAHMALVGDSDGETLIKLLGEDVANKVRKWDTSRVKNPEQNLKTPIEQGEINQRPKSTKRMTAKQWREFNRK